MNKVKDTNFGNKIFGERNIKIGVLKNCKWGCKFRRHLENFFTEYLISGHGTLFLGVWCD